MNRLLLLSLQVGLLLLLLPACVESFDQVDPRKFNQTLSGIGDLKTAEEVIELYYAYPPEEGDPKLSIEKWEMEDGVYEVVLIHDGQQDDSQRATKIVMKMKKRGEIWQVLEIRKNRKCWEGRGHTNWGTAYCS